RARSPRHLVLVAAATPRHRRRAFLVDHDVHLADRANVAVLVVDLRDRPGARRRQLDRRLVGHHLDERLVELDLVADLDLPRDDLALDDAFADIRHVEVEAHLTTPGLFGSRPARDRRWAGTRARASRGTACRSR